MLGEGALTAYLYDRGGERRIAQFEKVTKGTWERVLDDISEASIVAMTPAGNDWHGQIRSWRHELVIYRDAERVWEGPIYRVIFGRGFVNVLARDVLAWTNRRSHRGRFTGPTNAVEEGKQAVLDAMLFDDPNVTPWIETRPLNAPTIQTAMNAADGYYWDGIGDIVDQGVHVTAVGRRIVFWPATTMLSKTAPLDSDDLSDDVTVIEDGLSLSTRAVLTGGTTFGATTPEPVVRNYAVNPTFEGDTVGWTAAQWFALSKIRATWGGALYGGRVLAKPPSKPPKGSSAKKKSAYNEKFAAYEQSDVVLLAQPQAIEVHEGEDLSATLDVRGVGTLGRVGLRLVGIDADGVVSDKAFAEGPPVALVKDTTALLFVEGTVPKDISQAFVEVFRDTNYVRPVLKKDGTPKTADELSDKEKIPVKWGSADGIVVDNLGWWRGRIEDYFSGDSPGTDLFRFEWDGGPGASTSTRTLLNPIPDPYYGLVETLGRSNGATTRLTLEAAASAITAAGSPSPLAVDVPQDAPLRTSAPVGISELVAGAVVPLSVRTTSRELVAACVIDTVKVEYAPKTGEKVSVTLVSGQTFEAEQQ